MDLPSDSESDKETEQQTIKQDSNSKHEQGENSQKEEEKSQNNNIKIEEEICSVPKPQDQQNDQMSEVDEVDDTGCIDDLLESNIRSQMSKLNLGKSSQQDQTPTSKPQSNNDEDLHISSHPKQAMVSLESQNIDNHPTYLTLKNEFENLTNMFNELKTELTQTGESLNSQLTEKGEEISNLKQQLDSTKKEKEDIFQSLQTETGQVSQLKFQVTGLQQDCEWKKQALDSCYSQLKQLESQQNEERFKFQQDIERVQSQSYNKGRLDEQQLQYQKQQDEEFQKQESKNKRERKVEQFKYQLDQLTQQAQYNQSPITFNLLQSQYRKQNNIMSKEGILTFENKMQSGKLIKQKRSKLDSLKEKIKNYPQSQPNSQMQVFNIPDDGPRVAIQFNPPKPTFEQVLEESYASRDLNFYVSPITVEEAVGGSDGEYKASEEKKQLALRKFQEENISYVGKVRGDGNCFFRSFITLYLKSKIAQVQHDKDLLQNFLSSLCQIDIQQPLPNENFFGSIAPEEVVTKVKYYLQIFFNKLMYSNQTPLKEFIDSLNDPNFDFALQWICKSLLFYACKTGTENIKSVILEDLIRDDLFKVNVEGGSDELFMLITTILNCNLRVFKSTKNGQMEWVKFNLNPEFINNNLQPFYLEQINKDLPFCIWFKTGHYYYLLTKQQFDFIQRGISTADNYLSQANEINNNFGNQIVKNNYDYNNNPNDNQFQQPQELQHQYEQYSPYQNQNPVQQQPQAQGLNPNWNQQQNNNLNNNMNPANQQLYQQQQMINNGNQMNNYQNQQQQYQQFHQPQYQQQVQNVDQMPNKNNNGSQGFIEQDQPNGINPIQQQQPPKSQQKFVFAQQKQQDPQSNNPSNKNSVKHQFNFNNSQNQAKQLNPQNNNNGAMPLNQPGANDLNQQQPQIANQNQYNQGPYQQYGQQGQNNVHGFYPNQPANQYNNEQQQGQNNANGFYPNQPVNQYNNEQQQGQNNANGFYPNQPANQQNNEQQQGQNMNPYQLNETNQNQYPPFMQQNNNIYSPNQTVNQFNQPPQMDQGNNYYNQNLQGYQNNQNNNVNPGQNFQQNQYPEGVYFQNEQQQQQYYQHQQYYQQQYQQQQNQQNNNQ